VKQILRLSTTLGLVISILCLANVSGSAQPRSPNIVLIVSDDMGYADIGVHGSRDILTPNIDALARDGIRFTDAYVTGPYCSPTRAGLLTGRYPQRFGHEFNPDQRPTMHHEIGLPVGEITIADYFKSAGYRTALFGKWHLGKSQEFHPMSRGFDEFFGFLDGDHSYIDPEASGPDPLLEGRKPVTKTDYLTDVFTDRAVDFIRRQKARPFFLYVAYNAVHTPMQAPDKYLDRFPQIADRTRRTYAAMLSAMDDGIGRILAALRDSGLERNTLIIFFNDNGGPTMPGTTINGSNNAPLRGSKRQTWEGGIRVPFIIRWKGRLPEGKIDSRPIIQLDVLPTALAAAGIKPRLQSNLDGANLLPFITGKRPDLPHDALYWRLGENMAIRKGDWKLVKSVEGKLYAADPTEAEYLSGAKLYNLATDVGENKNLAAENPKEVRELIAAWKRWNGKLAKPLWGPEPRPASEKK
jgi:arylsulfatase A-like enzyme